MNDVTPAASPEFPEPDLSGQELGDYRLLRRLGRGGMAEVYLADQDSLRRRVALKVLRRNLAADETYVRRFHNEAHAAAALVHANIVQIYEVGCINGLHFIAQEYVDGQNLKQLVTRRGSLGVSQAVLIIRQVAAALYKAGKQGIVHRDIKPENILIGPTGETKVADFGLARIADDASKLNLTQAGITMGTPLYMSPEQVEGRKLDTRSDIYSLGVTCYHMLSGRPPFEGGTALNVAVQHLKTEPETLESVRPELPGGLCRIVHKMLAKSPDDRYADAAGLLRDLRQLEIEGVDSDWSPEQIDLDTSEQFVLADTDVGATQRLAALMKQSEATRASRRRRWAWPTLLVLGLLVGSALAWTTQSADVLQIGPDEKLPKVPEKDTVEQQFFYAMRVDTEEAWNAISEYFPPGTRNASERGKNKTYARRAKQNLARLYMRYENYDRALKAFEELVELDPTEEEFRAFGLAGQAIVLARLGRHEEAATTWEHAMPLAHHLEEDKELLAELMRIGPESRRPDQPPKPNQGPAAKAE